MHKDVGTVDSVFVHFGIDNVMPNWQQKANIDLKRGQRLKGGAELSFGSISVSNILIYAGLRDMALAVSAQLRL